MVKNNLIKILAIVIVFLSACSSLSVIKRDANTKYVLAETENALLYVKTNDVILSMRKKNDFNNKKFISFIDSIPNGYKSKGQLSCNFAPIKFEDNITGNDIELVLDLNDVVPKLLKEHKILVVDKSTNRFRNYRFKKKKLNYIAYFDDGKVFYSIPIWLLNPVIYN